MRWTAITRICSDPWRNADERRTERKDYKIMKYSYYPGCTLKTKAKMLDVYARASAVVLGFELRSLRTGSAAEVSIRLAVMRLRQSSPPSVR